MIDLHLHLLPGLDDGPADMDEALDMCRRAVRDGTRTVTATPHTLNGVYEVSRDEILSGVADLQDRVLEEGLDLQVKPGAEIHIHEDLVRFYREGKIMTLGDRGSYLLLEMPANMVPAGFDQYLFSLQLAGLNPIIAHPERNRDVQINLDSMIKAVSTGVMLQITAGSLCGDLR